MVAHLIMASDIYDGRKSVNAAYKAHSFYICNDVRMRVCWFQFLRGARFMHGSHPMSAGLHVRLLWNVCNSVVFSALRVNMYDFQKLIFSSKNESMFFHHIYIYIF